VLTQALYSWLCVYAEKLRSKVAATATVEMDKMFLSWNGKVMCSGQTTRK